MHCRHSPAELHPEERLAEIASILATGVLRLRQLRSAEATQESPAESAAGRLEVSDETVLSVHNG